jgi:phospholipase/carboxylesterase
MEKQVLTLQHNFKPSEVHQEKIPTIIMLHGYGSDENDLFSFSSELPKDFMIISLKAPLSMHPYGNAWYNIYFDHPSGKFSDDEQAIKSRELIVNCIDEIVEKYKADENNITLLGFSQGTILSYAVALSYPQKVKNVIGLSGYINRDIIKDDFERNDFSKLKVYSSHGSADQVIPVEWARMNKPQLESLNIDCTYSEFPVGHGVAPQNFFEFKEWLISNS